MASEYPQVRRRPTKHRLLDTQRDSNLVRASVLETALELGLTQNSAVANWIFNNPLAEEPEDIQFDTDKSDQLDPKSELTPEATETITPTLTSGSNTTSDESSSMSSPRNNAASAAVATFQIHMHKPSVTEPPRVSFGEFPSDQLQLFSPFSLSPPEPYRGETDVSSLGTPHKDTERSRSQDDSLRRNPSHDSPSLGPADAGYASEGQYLSKGKAGKEKHQKSKLKKGSKPQALDLNKGGGGDTDYASDGGYLSASSNKSQGKSPSKVKARAMAFFRRRPKKSAHGSDDEDEDEIPPVPAIPSFPRPSSPKLLERRAPSSPTRSGFHPLTLKLTSPPASPLPRRRMSKSPPPGRVGTPHRLGQSSASQPPPSPLVAPVALTPAATAATFSLPPSAPCTPLTAASFPAPATPSAPIAAPTPMKASSSQPPRPHLGVPPPAPPPSQPLPQPPPSPSAPSTLPLRPGTPSRKGAPSRPAPVAPAPPGYPGLQSPQPLSPRRAPSPFRPLLSPKVSPDQKVPHIPGVEVHANAESDQPNGTEVAGKQQSTTSLSASIGATPAFLQRRIQHRPPSPRPPPDMPLPPAPSPTPSARAHTPVGSPSKFHEHFSSVSSVPASHTSPTPSTATLSGSSSRPSVRSSQTSSTSDRSEVPPARDSLATSDYSRPTTSASTTSEVSYGKPVPYRFNRVSSNLKSRFSDRSSEVGSSVYPPTTHRDSTTTYDDDDGDVDSTAPKSFVDEEDDDESLYPSEDKTAGRRTMYLFEHGGLDENGDEIVIAGSDYWGKEVPPPLPTRPGFF